MLVVGVTSGREREEFPSLYGDALLRIICIRCSLPAKLWASGCCVLPFVPYVLLSTLPFYRQRTGPVTSGFSWKELLRRSRTKCLPLVETCSSVFASVVLALWPGSLSPTVHGRRGTQESLTHHYSSCVALASSLRSLSLGTARRVVGPIDHKGLKPRLDRP
jgi:hypothetical protein